MSETLQVGAGRKKERKVEELSVDGSAFKAVLEQARKRREARIGLRAMIDQAGPELREIVLRPGEIERMKRDLREVLRAKGDPGADEQVEEFGSMLVEIRRRVEEGTLRFSRPKPPREAADNGAMSADTAVADKLIEGGVAEPYDGWSSAPTVDRGEGGETESPRTAASGNEPDAQMARNAGEDSTEGGDEEGQYGISTYPPHPGTYDREGEVATPDEGESSASTFHQGRSDETEAPRTESSVAPHMQMGRNAEEDSSDGGEKQARDGTSTELSEPGTNDWKDETFDGRDSDLGHRTGGDSRLASAADNAPHRRVPHGDRDVD